MAKPNDLTALKNAAAILWPKWGPWAHETWERLNHEHFADALRPCGILFGLTPHGAYFGYFRTFDRTITLHPSLVDPAQKDPWGVGKDLGERFAADCLLHEMVHQHLHQTGAGSWQETGGTSVHNSPAWVDEVNRISPALGLNRPAEVIRQRRVNGEVKWAGRKKDGLKRDELAWWPNSVRPRGYYP